jgi:hypothetical protein
MKTFRYLLLLLCLLLSRPVPAQLDTVAFFQKVNSLYYTVESSGLQNFSMWVTSDYFRENIDSLHLLEDYPLEIIWIKPNRISFIKRPLSITSDTSKSRLIGKWQMEMYQELKGLLIDWQRFYGGGILDDLPPHYTLAVRQDTVLIRYQATEQGKKMEVCHYFGKNGLSLKLRFIYVDSGDEIHIYPVFDYLGAKWLCIGWEVQLLKNNEVSSGFIVQVFSAKTDGYWLPKKIIMQLQTRQNDTIIFKREYDIVNVMIDRPLKYME